MTSGGTIGAALEYNERTSPRPCQPCSLEAPILMGPPPHSEAGIKLGESGPGELGGVAVSLLLPHRVSLHPPLFSPRYSELVSFSLPSCLPTPKWVKNTKPATTSVAPATIWSGVSLHWLETAHLVLPTHRLGLGARARSPAWLCLPKGPGPHSCSCPWVGPERWAFLGWERSGRHTGREHGLSTSPHPAALRDEGWLRSSPGKLQVVRITRNQAHGVPPVGVQDTWDAPLPSIPHGWEFPNSQRQGGIQRPPPPLLGQWSLMPSKSERG